MPTELKTICAVVIAVLAAPALANATETEASPPVARQALDDAWWTGPLLASGANTLPRGHVLIEPYLFDIRTYGRFDQQGTKRQAPNDDSFGNLTYILYGLTDDLTVGVIPKFGYASRRNGTTSSGVQLGDVTVQGQYRLHRWRPDSWVPAVSVVVGEVLPKGKFDRLEGRGNDGFGSGAYATTFGLYSQTYFWTPDGRILRTRLDLSYTLPGRAHPEDQSVYGTPTGFEGYVEPSRVFSADLAFEYSVTRRWVLALDVGYEHDTAARVAGRVTAPAGGAPSGFQASSGSSEALILAPAVEYNLNANVGVIAGARIVAAGRNTTASFAPVMALNLVL